MRDHSITKARQGARSQTHVGSDLRENGSNIHKKEPKYARMSIEKMMYQRNGLD